MSEEGPKNGERLQSPQVGDSSLCYRMASDTGAQSEIKRLLNSFYLRLATWTICIDPLFFALAMAQCVLTGIYPHTHTYYIDTPTQTNTQTYAHTKHTRILTSHTHARTHAHTHTHTHIYI